MNILFLLCIIFSSQKWREGEATVRKSPPSKTPSIVTVHFQMTITKFIILQLKKVTKYQSNVDNLYQNYKPIKNQYFVQKYLILQFYYWFNRGKKKMSIYSGFATRQQQHKYNTLVETLIIALKKRIIKFYNQEQTDEEKFKLLVKKLYKKMFLLQRGKFMAPKYTSCFTDLIQELSIDINYDTISQCSSIASNITFRKDLPQSQQQLHSFNALKYKVNELQKKQEQKRQQSALSVPRKQKYVRISVQNQEEEDKRTKKMAESMYQAQERTQKRKKFRGPLVDLKQLRGTSHMPKWQDFAPKRSQIFPVSPRRSQKHISINPKVGQNSLQHTFRRQKYVKLDLKIQDI